MGFTIKKARDALERYNDGAPLSLLNFLRLLEEHMGEDIWGEKRYAIFALVNAEETEESLTVDFSEYAGME